MGKKSGEINEFFLYIQCKYELFRRVECTRIELIDWTMSEINTLDLSFNECLNPIFVFFFFLFIFLLCGNSKSF